MTYKGAINQLYEMRDNTLMPEFLKPYFDKIIETLTADVRENVKGEWIIKKDVTECSNCHTKWNNYRGLISTFYFCPDCGADMRGGKNEI